MPAGAWSFFSAQGAGAPCAPLPLLLVVFGGVELDEKTLRSRCAVLTLFVVTFLFGRVSRSRVAFERSSAAGGVGRTGRVSSLVG